jgi:hypothetical protein
LTESRFWLLALRHPPLAFPTYSTFSVYPLGYSLWVVLTVEASWEMAQVSAF